VVLAHWAEQRYKYDMSTEKQLYKTPSVSAQRTVQSPITAKAYRGMSTVSDEAQGVKLYDIALIKQDLVNHFHIRYGEKLENPGFGTIIWDILYDPLTDALKEAIVKNVSDIINYDPRVSVQRIIVDSYESGIQIECDLMYIPYSISETLQFRFDRQNGLI
jgi:phage baseplate assembly protein W